MRINYNRLNLSLIHICRKHWKPISGCTGSMMQAPSTISRSRYFIKNLPGISPLTYTHLVGVNQTVHAEVAVMRPLIVVAAVIIDVAAVGHLPFIRCV